MFLNSIRYIKQNYFTNSFCKKILQLGDNQKLESAKITTGNQNNRKSFISFIKDDTITKQITPIINEANTKSNWNFLLREFEPLQYTVYNEDNYYDWHIDSCVQPYDNGLIRKLSFSIFLNDDYTGGEFELCTPHPVLNKQSNEKFNLEKGSILIFPSHIWHKVHPVKSGIRKSLVGWIVGKPFV